MGIFLTSSSKGVSILPLPYQVHSFQAETPESNYEQGKDTDRRMSKRTLSTRANTNYCKRPVASVLSTGSPMKPSTDETFLATSHRITHPGSSTACHPSETCARGWSEWCREPTGSPTLPAGRSCRRAGPASRSTRRTRTAGTLCRCS